MFAMYDDDGLNFRSTIDNLYHIHSTAATAAIRSKTEQHNKEQFQDTLYRGKITQEAKEKYKQIASLDTKVEIFHVEQLMHKDIVYIDKDITIKEAYDLMKEHNIQQVPIYIEGTSKIKSMVSFRDILHYIMDDPKHYLKHLDSSVYNISFKKVITTDPISDIRRVAKVMIDFKLNAMAVVNSDDIVEGMISRHDIVDAVSNIPHLQIWA